MTDRRSADATPQPRRPAPAPGSGGAIRDAAPADIGAIREIYAHEVLHGLATFEEVPPPEREMRARWQDIAAQGLPYLVAEQDRRIAGYSYATGYRARSGYRYTIEDSVYVAEGMRGRGIGSALLAALIDRCEAGPWRQMIAVIGSGDNARSIALHTRLGFHRVGTLAASGFKFGRWVDSVLMQRPLGAGDRTPPGR